MQSLTVTGNLGADVEKKDVQGKTVYEFSLAANRGKDDTTWYRISCWGDFWKGVAQYLVKGKQVAVVGELSVRTYQKDGKDRFSCDIRADRVELLGGGSDKKDTSFDHGANEKKSGGNPFEG